MSDLKNDEALLDEFAGKAMMGFLTNPQQDYAPLISGKAEMLAKESYGVAYAMLAEKKRRLDARSAK